MAIDKKVLNVPHLRFPEFTERWDTYRIADILCIGNGRDYKHLSKGDIPVFGTGGYMTSVNECLYEGETTFIGRKGTINKPFYYNGKFWTVDTLFYTHSFKRVIPKFVYCLFQTINWLRYNEASGVPSLSKDTIEKIKVRIPQLDEQKKIAKLLSLLDERIATQNKIIEKLQSLIKGIAQNIVHRNKPNVRISQCLECSSSTLQESDVLECGAYPVYGANGVVGFLDNYNTSNEAIYIIKDGSGVGAVSYVAGKCSATGTLNILQAKKGFSLRYLYYLLNIFNFEPYKTGMAIPHIYFKDYGKAQIFCPSYSEQLKYAKFLATIDDKLLTEQNVLINLSLLKQYLLRQMFI
ncbi:restriction endonuclease subunit S [Alistipes shahii]|nr:restriction endonuclease subunit S [Alistipes shahii]UWN67224.1 restriction endonuclease subunit S [Alistipes shahii WAL 8301]